MTEGSEEDLHPIVNEALSYARPGQQEPVELEDGALDKLNASLAKYYGKPELVGAVVELLGVAAFFDKRNSPRAALCIIAAAVSSADALSALGAASAAAFDKLEEAQKEHDRFVSATEKGPSKGAGLVFPQGGMKIRPKRKL